MFPLGYMYKLKKGETIMYPGSIFEWEDDSVVESLAIADTTVRPVFMAGITSDKGTEDFTTQVGSAFFKQYGDISFAKHGQPLLQAANIINAGGKLFVKRVVAPDSALANIGLVAKVTKLSIQKTNSAGKLVYTDADGNETIESTNTTPVMINQCKVEYELKSVAITGNDIGVLCNAFKSANPEAHVLGESGTYLLFVIADVGRGTSKKKIRITPDYNASRGSEVAKYIFEILEDSVVIETMTFTINPDVVESSKNISLQSVVTANSSQVRARVFESYFADYVANVAAIANNTDTTFIYQDVLFGKTIKGVAIDNITVDTTVDVRNIYGTALAGGSNGAFGTRPIEAASYDAEMVKVFNGTYDDTIYNLDNNKLNFVVDACYSATVKRAIESVAAFREDCMYFRDMGKTGLRSVDEIDLANADNLASRYCATYHNYYDIIDPYSKKQITVTIGYDIAAALVTHFLNGRSRPFAGILYGVVFANAIEGTINFIPKIIPSANQKTQLEDLRINFASFYDGVLTMETLYTSQERFTQLSFLNNVLAVQEVIQAIRSRCPKIRYTFMDGDDYVKYKEDVEAVIAKYSSNFQSIAITYSADTTYVANKIFYATLKVKFRNFVQTEYFKVIALPSSTATSTSSTTTSS